jgi:glycosyltransferase involved in cell wall biosynthesis
MRKKIHDRGLSDRVILTGGRSRVAPWIDACDALVVPSREEGMPVAAIEAMMRGRAVVGTRVGGTPEVVVDGETGLLVPPGDPAALETALRRLVDDIDLRHRMGRAGREVARNRFSLDRMAEATLREYERLLHTEGAVSRAGIAPAKVR